jgi:hypothetical protein
MTLSDDLVANAARAKVLEDDLAQAQADLAIALADNRSLSAEIDTLQLQITNLQRQLDECQNPPPVGSYLFGVTRVSLPAFTDQLAPATIQVERTYETTAPVPWRNVNSILFRGNIPAVSFKGNTLSYAYSIGEFLAGLGPVYLSFHHEIENEIPGAYATPEAYAADFDKLMGIITPLAPNVIPTLILMAQTFSSPDVGRYLPASAKMIGADGYDWNPCKTPSHYRDASVVFAGLPEFADAVGLPWGIFETNAPYNEPRKPEYIASVGAFARSRHASVVLAWDSDGTARGGCDFRSTGSPAAMDAWREVATDRTWT